MRSWIAATRGWDPEVLSGVIDSAMMDHQMPTGHDPRRFGPEEPRRRGRALATGWLLAAAVLCGAASLAGSPADADPTGTPVLTGEHPAAAMAVSTGSREEYSLPEIIGAADGVKDPVFGILINLVATGAYGTITEERLREELDRLGRKSPLPYTVVRTITRAPVRPGWTARITVDLHQPINLSVPYSILGYHPGNFTTTRECSFREWQFPRLDLVETSGRGDDVKQRTVTLEQVHLFALDDGEIWIDIDTLVDRLLGGAIDDTRVTVLALGRYQGEWIGVASGYGRNGKGRSGLLGFQKDKIIFPTPDALKGVGRQLRSKAEMLARIWEAGEQGMGTPAALDPGN